MHLNGSTIVAIVAIITLALAAAGVVGGQFRITRSQQILANYREAAQAWEMKSRALEQELDEVRTQMAEKQDQLDVQSQRLTEMSGQMKALQEMMVGSSALESIRQDIAAAQERILAAIGAGHA